MNKVYKSVCNESIGAWVAVSETAKGRGKKTKKQIVSSVVLAGASAAGGLAIAPAAFASQVCATGPAGVGTSSIQGGSATLLSECGSNAYLPSGHDIAQIEAGASVVYADGTAGTVNFRATAGGTMVTINSAGQISNIGAGTASTDAVNLGQLTAALASVKSKYLNVNSTLADSTATGTETVAIGGAANAIGDGDISIGRESYANGQKSNAIALGTHTTASGLNTMAIGDTALASANYAEAFGAFSTASAANATALGFQATASTANSVALGSNSVADRAGTVSVGNATTRRQIVNVAAGTQAYDAVNVTQLQSVTTLLGGGAKVNADGTVQAPSYTVAGTSSGTVGDAISKLDSELTNKVAYDTTDKSHVTLGGVGTSNLVTVSNVAAGALSTTSTDAVNGSQLNSTNTRVGSLETFATNINNGGGIKYFHSNSQLADSSATGADAVAIGGAAVASADNSVAIGANSAATRVNTVSVGSAGKERQITNVAAGMAFTDAVNVAQLNALSDLAVKYDTNPNGSVNYQSVTLGGASASKTTKLTNLSAADLTSSSTDAVNGSQLYATNQDVSSLKTFANNINNGGGIKYFHSNSSQADSSATGADAVAIGGSAQASANNSVALGANSVANRKDAVSVGAAGSERQIINVAAGTTATDAVNLAQLTTVSNNLDTLSSFAVKYDDAAGKPNYQSITLGGTAATQPTKLTNLLAADLSATSKDAVNGSQLFATNTRVGSLETFENNINNGGGIKYFHTNSTLADSSATGADSVAVGGAAVASGKNAVALGSNSVADRDNSVSVGAAGKERQITNVAAGTTSTDAVNLAQLTAVSQDVAKLDSFAVKYDTADGQPNYESVTLGGAGATKPTKLTNLKIGDLSSTSTDAINGSQLYSTNQRVGSLETFESNINNGGGIKYFHTNSKLADSSATGTDSVAVGGAALASANNAVALGSNSVADRANTVSVGAAGKERQVTNVAAGTASTDAVNVGQLTAVSNNLDTLDSFAVKYDTDENGKPNYEKITLGGTSAAKPTLLTNLAAGKLAEDSTEAVNGSQLYATNTNVSALQDFTNNISNGGGIKYFHTNSTLADSSATGADSVAIGGAAVSSGKNAVALGSNSVADRDNSVSVGAAGSERQITNVAAGTATTDAANVGQLNAVSNSVSTLSAAAIKYDTNADGTPDYGNATLGNGNADGTALHNVAAGTNAMDAVNLSQVNDLISQVTNIANGAYNPLFTADGSRDTEAATSSGTHSVASGANAVASGVNAVASGASSVASGANAVAVGANASATAKNSVALGSGSVADRANSVSVGTTAAGGQRQITNVAAGTEGTDAVNVNQMQQSVNTGVKSAKGYTDALRSDMNSSLSIQNNHINSVGAMSSAMAMMAGSAAAIADKDNRFAAGTGVYRDKAAIAIGFQKRFGTNMVLTIGGSTTGEESTGGAGFAFGF